MIFDSNYSLLHVLANVKEGIRFAFSIFTFRLCLKKSPFIRNIYTIEKIYINNNRHVDSIIMTSLFHIKQPRLYTI